MVSLAISVTRAFKKFIMETHRMVSNPLSLLQGGRKSPSGEHELTKTGFSVTEEDGLHIHMYTTYEGQQAVISSFIFSVQK